MFKALYSVDDHYTKEGVNATHSDTVFRIKKAIAKDFKPDYLIFTGDNINCDGISKFTYKRWERGYWDTIKEIKGFRRNYYKPLIEACNNPKLKIVYIKGNHDGERFDKFFDKMRTQEERETYEIFKRKADFKLIFPEAFIVEYNDYFQLGDLAITHGEYCNMNHAKTHAESYTKDVLYGHLHTLDFKTISKKDKSNTVTAYSMPCGIKLGINYMKNKTSSWKQGFAVSYFTDNGSHYTFPIVVKNKKTIFEGRVYT